MKRYTNAIDKLTDAFCIIVAGAMAAVAAVVFGPVLYFIQQMTQEEQ